MLRPMLVARAALRQQYGVLHTMVLELVRREPTCQRLMTIPGVGALTAITFVTTIDDPDRFQPSRDVWRTSRPRAAQICVRGDRPKWRPLKVGDVMLRTVLYQAALALLTHPALVRIEGLGCAGSQASRSSPSGRGSRTKIIDRDASDLDRW